MAAELRCSCKPVPCRGLAVGGFVTDHNCPMHGESDAAHAERERFTAEVCARASGSVAYARALRDVEARLLRQARRLDGAKCEGVMMAVDHVRAMLARLKP